ncbi:MAG: 4-(cytidine 5'-diphospho)-2-C-methyl-D-erythritol kinase [Candidatus Eremiobacteraeota bacterium]|nr:4-(cytidine 5'-diphospho)-2-C-methyl-D-erythritol kinase [Candidatus Eremiobacteraeota bacterium]
MKASETLRAPAKLNLTLEVLAQRADGLHGVRSVMVPVDLCDELEIESANEFRFVCDAPELAGNNLVERAVRALDVNVPNVHILLRKRIPTGAGMGGGSSDAAAVLLAAQRGVFGVRRSDFLAIARSLGSDVPFFLAETAALVESTGERVTALGALPPWHALVIKPPVSISTAWAYRQIDESPRPSRPRNSSISLAMAEALQRREFQRVESLLQNDFHDAIVPAVPEIARALEVLRNAGATQAVLTGTGSCVFTLAQTREKRDELAERVALPDGYRLYACAFWNGEPWRSAA